MVFEHNWFLFLFFVSILPKILFFDFLDRLKFLSLDLKCLSCIIVKRHVISRLHIVYVL